MKLRHLQPLAAAAIGFALPAPLLWSRDFGTVMTFELFLTPLGVLVMVGLVVLLLFESRQARRMTLLALACLPAAAAASYALVAADFGDRVRWFADRAAHRQRIETAAVASGEFKHFEWNEDGWGGMNFFDYVVYDPSDRLAETWSRSKDGRVPGLPCPADYGMRFERGYYKVTFPLPWGDCGP